MLEERICLKNKENQKKNRWKIVTCVGLSSGTDSLEGEIILRRPSAGTWVSEVFLDGAGTVVLANPTLKIQM